MQCDVYRTAGLALVAALVLAGVVQAASPPVVRRSVIGGGEARRTSGVLTMNTTIGQPVIGVSQAGEARLSWGYWGPIPPPAPTGTQWATPTSLATATGHATSTATDWRQTTHTPTPVETVQPTPDESAVPSETPPLPDGAYRVYLPWAEMPH